MPLSKKYIQLTLHDFWFFSGWTCWFSSQACRESWKGGRSRDTTPWGINQLRVSWFSEPFRLCEATPWNDVWTQKEPKCQLCRVWKGCFFERHNPVKGPSSVMYDKLGVGVVVFFIRRPKKLHPFSCDQKSWSQRKVCFSKTPKGERLRCNVCFLKLSLKSSDFKTLLSVVFRPFWWFYMPWNLCNAWSMGKC